MSREEFQNMIDKLIRIAVNEPHRFPTLSTELAIKFKKIDLIDKDIWRKYAKRRAR